MTSTQERYFLESLGDDWLERNKNDLGKVDPVQRAFDMIENFSPKSVLEIGCCTGWRLKRIRDKYGCDVRGIDPSTKAIEEGRILLKKALRVGVASSLPFQRSQFDTVILGFCICLCDPNDWQAIIAESNRVLQDRGLLLIHDYHQSTGDLKVGIWPYQHTPPVPWWFFDWKKLWLSHPGYRLVADIAKEGNPQERVVVLQKTMPSFKFEATT